MKNWMPALSRLFGHEHRGYRAARLLLGVGLEAQLVQAAAAVLRALRRILRQRIAALDDAHRNHAMESRPVVGAFTRTGDEVRHVIGGRVAEQVEHDHALTGLEHRLLVAQLGRLTAWM